MFYLKMFIMAFSILSYLSEYTISRLTLSFFEGIFLFLSDKKIKKRDFERKQYNEKLSSSLT